ncbi:major histocompatibility complex class I-related gene protein-like [Acipenser oxyrinchus oxyrinchus]|uniref:Major histocompatibility complex class I-related gene protein-like n=1 Tax=Acipenser oxyrinchus oxyrinchus TaxID=40147 RepID=A0AAD8FQE4_ACIOX|nr:major histocompatibility complex class I-related gene protein-like [Acipenser oxyrinchus oxyrinchus]KAK1153376.1 major histocompatibility complex class I-related gene protein-like [Acipenser oxyrinchus oxyrinchus]
MYVGMLDDVQISYYDSTMEKPVLRTHWSNKTKSEEFLKIHTDYIIYGREVRKWSLRNIVQHFNHTGVHTYHNTGGCELDDDGTRRVYSSHEYDGKDFISIDVETMTWIAAVPQAVFYKHKREANTAWQHKTSDYYQEVCFQLLEWCVQYGVGTLQRKGTEQPHTVFLLNILNKTF